MRSVLADSQALADFLEMVLNRDMLRSVDNEILNGDGSGAGQGKRFTGLANSGLPTQAVAAGSRWEALVAAAGKVRAADWQGPLSVVLNATDATELALEKSTAGEPVLDDGIAALAFLGVEQFVFSTVQAAGTGYVGSFGEGATLYVRQAPTLSIADSDGSDFLLGKVVLGLEARLALRVSFPSAFVQVTGL
jgi:HK97 family phage major capsid protein